MNFRINYKSFFIIFFVFQNLLAMLPYEQFQDKWLNAIKNEDLKSLAEAVNDPNYSMKYSRHRTTIDLSCGRFSRTIELTPIHWACYFGSIQSLQYLILNDFPLNFATTHGITPLHLMFFNIPSKVSYEIIKILLDHGASVNSACMEHNLTVLHLAIKSNSSLFLIKLLLDYGAEPNAVDLFFGETPIFSAQSRDIVALLVKYGAFLNCTNSSGHTVYNILLNKNILSPSDKMNPNEIYSDFNKNDELEEPLNFKVCRIAKELTNAAYIVVITMLTNLEPNFAISVLSKIITNQHLLVNRSYGLFSFGKATETTFNLLSRITKSNDMEIAKHIPFLMRLSGGPNGKFMYDDSYITLKQLLEKSGYTKCLERFEEECRTNSSYIYYWLANY